jgi:hypothetical protein
MSTESQLREKLRKIEALFAGAGTTGERLAAEAALERVRARLTELGHKDSPVEMQFSMPDQWSRHLFLALCRRYGLSPIVFIGNGATPSWSGRRGASSIRFFGPSSASLIAPCRPIFMK